MAQMKDRRGDWDGAIEAIEHCKRVQRRHEATYLAGIGKAKCKIREMIEDLTRDDFRRWRDETVASAKPRASRC